ncbi:site-specific integrase [Pseudomonas sp. CC6-YY-74]|uniref:site-specific integrase n=1 Tax=Pseudomonas sp. CC6-YY-74 TaxID=1930532 RepID=UPI0009A1A834|nr:site-specific integrase [Pseudomonas sp. CC6-YY-74]
MALIAQPFRHPDSGIYYLRRRVPDDIRSVIGKTEIRRSLNTRNHHQAKAAFAAAYAESEKLFQQARQGDLHGLRAAQTGMASDGETCPPLLSQHTPAVTSAPVPARQAVTAPTLSQVFQRYAESLALSGRPEYVHRRHLVDYGRAVERFTNAIGDLSITSIGPTEIQAFAALLTSTQAKGKDKPLAVSTVRLTMARLSSVMAYAVDSGLVQSNPVITSRIHKRLGSAKPKRCLDDDRSYAWSELVKMFSQPEFVALRHAEGRPGNALFWLPLIAAYTGARREEIAQLYVSDVRQNSNGQWFIRIIDDRPDKSVKTDSSRRDIPLHTDLIALGLLELVQGNSSSSRIFPQLVKVSDGFAGIVSKAWRPLTQKWGIYRAGRSPLHAFRHTFKTLCREAGIPKEVHDWITGHSSGQVGDSYGSNPLSRMAKELEKLPSIAKEAGLLTNTATT